MRTPSVHLLGDLMVDIAFNIGSLGALTIARGSDFPSEATFTPGGSAANTATWLARCGMNVSLVGALGDDPLGDYLTNEIGKAGVNMLVQRVPDQLTGICLILNESDGERTMLPSAGANAAFQDSELQDHLAVSTVNHVHISAYMLFHQISGATALAYMAAARRFGATISLDPASSALLAPNRERLMTALAMCDLLLANADEALEITRLLSAGENVTEKIDLELVSTAMHQASPVVVVTDGSEPVLALADAIRSFASPVAKIDSVTSTTGAGDAFNAGYLNAWLTGANIPASLAAGTSLASRVLGQVGATTLTTALASESVPREVHTTERK